MDTAHDVHDSNGLLALQLRLLLWRGQGVFKLQSCDHQYS
jgi:hypothetical protein